MNKQLLKEQEKYESYLESHSLRLSPGRQAVFKEAMRTHGHFTAEGLVKSCSSVSRASIYRYLRELLEAGVIRETAYGPKHQNFEHVYDEKLHHHARCVRCGQMIEFPDDNEENRYRPILEKQGFKILGHELTFYGICKKCQ